MAFVDRVVDYPNRFTLTDTNNNVTGPYTLTRDEGNVSVAGTLLNAANLNEQTQLDSSVLSDFTSAGMTSSAQNDMSDALGFVLDAINPQTSGSWKYVKIGGGLTVAWAKLAVTIACTTASPAYGGYRSDAITVSIPTGIFANTPTWAWAQKNTSNSMKLFNCEPYSSTSLRLYFGSGESTTSTRDVSFLVIG